MVSQNLMVRAQVRVHLIFVVMFEWAGVLQVRGG